MAREVRRIGIRTAQVRLPEMNTPGNAIIRFGTKGQDLAFQRQADKRAQEAQQAASAINFERDGEGNLVAPTLPLTEDGLLAPSIYDREYTKMLGLRYTQQTALDTSKRLNAIATDHALDPDGYEKVAMAYVNRVTELAPDPLKADVNMAAQRTMVEHFNHITRKRAEYDHKESAEVHQQALQSQLNELAGYTVGGEDPEVIGAKRMQIRAAIAEGEELNYWNESGSAARIKHMDQKFAIASVTKKLNELPNDELSYRQAISDLTDFATGAGKIEMIDDFGQLQNVPVEDVYPDPEERQLIADAGITVLRQKEAARGGFETAVHGRQNQNFYDWYLPHSLDVVRGAELNRNQLGLWYGEAQDEENLVLQKQITAILAGSWADSTGGSMTLEERRNAYVVEESMQNYNDALQEFVTRNGADSLNDLSPEQVEQFNEAFWRRGEMDFKQTKANAMDLHDLYDAFNGGRTVDFRMSSLEDIQEWINNGPARGGVITMKMEVPLNSMLSSENQKQIDRALDIGRMLLEHRGIASNITMESALGRNGAALVHLIETYSPGAVTAEIVGQELHKFTDPNYTPHLPWKDLDRDDREAIMAEMDKELDDPGRFLSLVPQGGQIQSFHLNPLRPRLSGYPPLFRAQLYNEIQSRAGFIDPSNPSSYERHIDTSINALVNQRGWVPSKLGWSESRFDSVNERIGFDSHQADFAFTQHAPEAFYKTPDGAPMPTVMRAIEEDFQSYLNDWWVHNGKQGPKLIAGENAFLDYNSSQSYSIDGRFVPAYNVRTIDSDIGRGLTMSDDRFLYGDTRAISFEAAYQRGMQVDMDTWDTRDKASKLRTRIHQERIQTGESFGDL